MSKKQLAILLLLIGCLWETGPLKYVVHLAVPGIAHAAPFKTDKLSVMIVKGPLKDQTREQDETINGTGWRAAVPKDHFRVLDYEAKITDKEDAWVRDAYAVKRDSLPWVIISNGSTGFSGPLPDSEAALTDLIKKYGD